MTSPVSLCDMEGWGGPEKVGRGTGGSNIGGERRRLVGTTHCVKSLWGGGREEGIFCLTVGGEGRGLVGTTHCLNSLWGRGG